MAQFRCIALHPAPDRDMVDGKVAFDHHLFQVSEAQPKPEIPTDTQNDDFGFKMSSFELRWPIPVHEPQAYQNALPTFNTSRGSTWQYRYIDWFRDLGFVQKPGVQTKAARDIAAFLTQPARPAGGGRKRRPRWRGRSSCSGEPVPLE